MKPTLAPRTWIPVDYLDEGGPSARASPDAWVIKLPEGASLVMAICYDWENVASDIDELIAFGEKTAEEQQEQLPQEMAVRVNYMGDQAVTFTFDATTGTFLPAITAEGMPANSN